MRKIFSSQRVETAEGVARLLRDAGIDVRLSNGRSYRSKRSGQFSYLEQGSTGMHPTVWVVHADDQPRARELLREARLLDTTRRDVPFAEYAFADAPETQAGTRNWAWRIRIGLLLVIGVVALFIVVHRRGAPPVAPPAPAAVPAKPAPAPPAQAPQDTPQDDPSRVRIQPTQ